MGRDARIKRLRRAINRVPRPLETHRTECASWQKQPCSCDAAERLKLAVAEWAVKVNREAQRQAVRKCP